MTPPRLEPGQLWKTVRVRSAEALAAGALQTVSTRSVTIPDGGVNFVVRVAENLQRKQEVVQRSGEDAESSPFLPPEPALTVGTISGSHVAVLNKFNVVPEHLLVVTRVFRHQETLLDRADFEALAFGLAEQEVLAFYNGGRAAGASQAHKHLQLVPLRLAGASGRLPIEAVIDPGAAPFRLAAPFRHDFALLPADLWRRTQTETAAVLETLYREQLKAMEIATCEREGALWQGAPYNLLVTRRWMMLVPRRREHVEGISLNALAFAGSLFVRDRDELRRVQTTGPMRMLESAA